MRRFRCRLRFWHRLGLVNFFLSGLDVSELSGRFMRSGRRLWQQDKVGQIFSVSGDNVEVLVYPVLPHLHSSVMLSVETWQEGNETIVLVLESLLKPDIITIKN